MVDSKLDVAGCGSMVVDLFYRTPRIIQADEKVILDANGAVDAIEQASVGGVVLNHLGGARVHLDRCQQRLVEPQIDGVELALPRAEFAAGRKDPCHVARVVFEVGRVVELDEVAVAPGRQCSRGSASRTCSCWSR